MGYKGKNFNIPICLFCLDIENDIYNGVKFQSPKGIKDGHVVYHNVTKSFQYVRFVEVRRTIYGVRNFYYCDSFSGDFLHAVKWFKEEDIRGVNPDDDEECSNAENWMISIRIGDMLTSVKDKNISVESKDIADLLYNYFSDVGSNHKEESITDKINSKIELEKLPKGISLFSGAGGYDVGIAQSFNIVGHVEWNEKANQTYELNKEKFGFGNSECIGTDITKITNEQIKEVKKRYGKIDLVFGGPPCQGFTLAGKRDSKDPRNSLFIDYARFVEFLKPTIFQMENVKGLKSAKTESGESVLKIILNTFTKLGYSLSWVVHDASNYGVAQTRKRIILSGHLGNKKPSFPLPTFIGPGEGLSSEDWRFKMKLDLCDVGFNEFEPLIPSNELEELWDKHVRLADEVKLEKKKKNDSMENIWLSSDEFDEYLKENPEFLEDSE